MCGTAQTREIQGRQDCNSVCAYLSVAGDVMSHALSDMRNVILPDAGMHGFE